MPGRIQFFLVAMKISPDQPELFVNLLLFQIGNLETNHIENSVTILGKDAGFYCSIADII